MTDQTSTKEQAQLYLITPPVIDLETFPALLGKVLDVAPVACLRLALASKDENVIIKTGDALREICHARDIAIVIENHLIMVDRLGLDGVHLTDGARTVRYARKELGDDAIIGTYCAASRHDGMNAGEASAEYVSFGPCGDNALGDGSVVPTDLFQWWSDVVEVPVVAEGALTVDVIKTLSSVTDFFAIGEEIWNTDDPVAAFKTLVNAVGS
ncbi:thiamine phosphate synthase [Profundibacter sp.]